MIATGANIRRAIRLIVKFELLDLIPLGVLNLETRRAVSPCPVFHGLVRHTELPRDVWCERWRDDEGQKDDPHADLHKPTHWCCHLRNCGYEKNRRYRPRLTHGG